MNKLSLYALFLSFTLGSGYSAFAQETSTEESKITIEILGGFANHDMTTTIGVGSLTGFPNINTEGLGLEQILPESENGPSFGLRGSYNFWEGISVYGQLGYFSIGNGELANVQETIDPLLQSGILPDVTGIDWENLKIDARVVGNYQLFNSSIGLSYSYTIDKISIVPYAGLGYYNLNAPGAALDASITLLVFPIGADGLFKIDEQSKGTIGYQAGININYNVTEKFFVGFNAEYNKADFDFDESNIEFDESAIPTALGSFLNGIDLGLIPDLPLDTKIDYSSIKFGLTLGMKL